MEYFLEKIENKDYRYIKKEGDFLPGIKEYYNHFKKLAEVKGLSPEDAINSITIEGETTFYDIIDKNSYQKIYKRRISSDGLEKSDFIGIGTL